MEPTLFGRPPDETHEITVVPAKDGREGLYQAVCSCGNYESPPTFESHAIRSGVTHITAAHQNE
jgi:hypothetical protein